MQKADILHLATLSRIRISDDEAEALLGEIESVLAYVSEVNTIAADQALEKKVGTRFNIFREDVVTNEGGTYTESLLKEAPHVQGRHIAVKKILQQD